MTLKDALIAEWAASPEPSEPLQRLLHRARDLPNALLNQRWRLADISDRLPAIVKNAKVP